MKLAKNGLEPWSDMVIDICLDQANTHTSGNLRVEYTGVSESLDRALCILVNYNQSIFHHVLGIHFERLLMGATASVMAIMAIESSRKGNRTSILLGLYPILLFFANSVGISVIFLAIWIPVCLFNQSEHKKSDEWAIVSRSRAFGIVTAILVGFGIPACYLTSSLVPHNSEIEQNGLAIWQFMPFLVVPLFYAFEQVFEFVGSYIDQVADQDMRHRLYISEGRDACEKTFLLLGILNMFLYQGTFVMMKWSGIHIVDALTMLLKAPGSLPAGLTFAEIGQILSTRTGLLDYISLTSGFVIWAGFSSGLREAITVVLLSLVVGPAAAGCFYAYYREGCIQYITKTTYTVEKTT
ncbi:hypothetical protein K501DRAFT_206266, partial [Backusella circina FSU 941]